MKNKYRLLIGVGIFGGGMFILDVLENEHGILHSLIFAIGTTLLWGLFIYLLVIKKVKKE